MCEHIFTSNVCVLLLSVTANCEAELERSMCRRIRIHVAPKRVAYIIST